MGVKMGKQTIFINIEDTFTRLKVIDIVSGNGNKKYKCLCECGNVVFTEGKHLARGDTKSCGCYARDYKKKIKHGDSRSRLYKAYHAMKNRCTKQNMPNYKHYGQRGITVCADWLSSYEKFREWALNNGYAEHLTIDRIDNNGNYEPSNCRWVDMKMQGNNQRRNQRHMYDGEVLTIMQLSEKYGIEYNTLRFRLLRGLKIKEAIETPVRKRRRHSNVG